MQSNNVTVKRSLTIALAAAVIGLLAAFASTISGAEGSMAIAAGSPPPSGGTTVIAISCGGKAASPYVADTDFSGGGVSSGTTHAITTTGITDPAPQEVYQHGRDGNFTYTIPSLTAGTAYVVRLHFCEYYFSSAGKRTFNVSINGTQVLTDFDIFKTAGGQYIANVQQFSANANSSGKIVIQFTSVVNNSLVGGIQIETTGSSSSSSSSSAATSSTSSTSASSASGEENSSSSSGGGLVSPYSAPNAYLADTGNTNGSTVDLDTTASTSGNWATIGVATNTYLLEDVSQGGLCLQSAGDTSGSGAEVWTCTETAAQEWNFVADSSPANYYQLQQAGASGTLCLDAIGTTNGSAVQVVTCNGSNGQQWYGPGVL
jgi:hypothetical protein